MKKILFVFLALSIILPQGKISGIGFYNYSHNVSIPDERSFSFDRIYLTYKNNISDDISFKFQTDVGRLVLVEEDDNGSIILGNKSNLFTYIKKAQLDWKLSFGKIILGMQGMNIFNVTEKNWGFRFIEKSPMDKHNFSSSADMGVGFSSKFKSLNYSILFTNGSGYKKEENDFFKKTSIQLVYGQKNLSKNDGFNLGFSFSTERYSLDIENPLSVDHGTDVISYFIGFSRNRFKIGGEFDTYLGSSVGGDHNNDNRQILAFYSSYKIMDNLEGLVYVDMYDPIGLSHTLFGVFPNTKTGKNSETYIIAGLSYYPTKGLIISPNIRMTSFENGSDTEIMLKMNFQFKF